jgi:copper chaperone
MTCGHCVSTVTDTVHQIDSQATVNIDLPSHRVRIESEHAPEEFRKALSDEGYTPA